MKKLKYVIAITTGVLFDLLFWEKMYGFSFALFISVFSVAVLIIEKIRIRDLPRLSLIPYFLAILFALLTFIRLELFTTFFKYVGFGSHAYHSRPHPKKRTMAPARVHRIFAIWVSFDSTGCGFPNR